MLASKLRYLSDQAAFREDPVGVLLRLGWWWLRSRIPYPASIYFKKWDLSLSVPPRWRGAAKLLYAFRERFELELGALPHLVGPGACVVDVGACYGIYACLLGRLVGPAGKVYAFEPAQEAFVFLERNLGRNAITWAEAHRVACADFRGEALLRHEPDPSRNALALSSLEKNLQAEKVKVVLLDDVVPQADFLKLDVEGSEELVLKGAMRLLTESRPMVLFEVNTGAACRLGLEPAGAWRLLSAFGYRFFRVERSGELSRIEEPLSYNNILALPRA
ncbi:MAG: FkbM family methyltransferase [Bacteroidota bacterium]|nr:FkbM family methyltransferase [Bacteroidota bacterium]